MATPRKSKFIFLLPVLAIGGGAFVLAAPQIVIQRPTVPQAQVPTIQVPVVGPPRGVRPQSPNDPNRVPMQLPVMSAELARAYVEAAERGLDYLPGRVLVKFRNGTGASGQQRALGAVGVPNASLERVGDVMVVKDSTGTDPHLLAAQFETQPEVEYAEPDYLMHADATPNDPSYATRQWNFPLIALPTGWDLSAGGSASVIVAVVDTGITSVPAQNITVKTWGGSSIVDYTFPVAPSPDFTFSRFVLPRDFTLSTTSPPAFVVDTDRHGTHVAGTIGEDTNNNLSLAGIAYNARIMPLKACTSYWDVQFAISASGTPGRAPTDSGGCSSSATSAAIRFAADNGARVLNYSIGGTSPNTTVRDAMQYAISRGVFIAMSNGNEGEDGNPTTYPASYGPSLNGAMAVAATTRIETKSYYSSFGSWTEIAAPGGDSKQGNVIWQATLSPSDTTESTTFLFPRFDRYSEVGLQGTSMASPHVAGLAALLVSRIPGITPAQIEQVIKRSAKDIGTPGRDDSFGYGLIQARTALYGLGIR